MHAIGQADRLPNVHFEKPLMGWNQYARVMDTTGGGGLKLLASIVIITNLKIDFNDSACFMLLLWIDENLE